MDTTINVTVPASWHSLSQQQLLFLLSTIVNVNQSNKNVPYASQAQYAALTAAQVQTICFLKWADITVVCPYDDGYLLSRDGKEFHLPAETIADAATRLDWVSQLPSHPIRLDSIGGAKAVPADISSGLSFDNWLACETLWQRYNANPDDQLLRQMAAILYGKADINPSAAETLGIFYWWAGLKNMLSEMFPNFFKPSDTSSDSQPPSYDDMRRNIDAQIRALTKGDVTKECEVLSLDAIRAITELDAQAREYDELRSKYPTK